MSKERDGGRIGCCLRRGGFVGGGTRLVTPHTLGDVSFMKLGLPGRWGARGGAGGGAEH